jgi:hypothetical protein
MSSVLEFLRFEQPKYRQVKGRVSADGAVTLVECECGETHSHARVPVGGPVGSSDGYKVAGCQQHAGYHVIEVV